MPDQPSPTPALRLSPDAYKALIDAVEEGDAFSGDELEGCTDCPDGCVVEPDGYCPHGWLSATETLMRTVA